MARIIKALRRGPAFLPAEVADARIRARSIVDAAREAAAGIHEEARADGLAEGRQAGRAELAATLIELAQAQRAALDALEPQAVRVALEATKKLVGQELATRPAAFEHVVGDLLQRLRHAQRVAFSVHPDDRSALDRACARFAADAEHAVEISVTTDVSLTRGDCLVESSVGTLDARVETRIAALARALEAK